MLAYLYYPLQCGDTPLHYAVSSGHTTCVKRPGVDVNIKDHGVSWSIECYIHE